MTLRDQFLTLARLYAQAEGIELSALSSRIFDDSKKIPALESGRDLTTGRFEVGVAYIADRWPAELPWPEGVYRPRQTEAGKANEVSFELLYRLLEERTGRKDGRAPSEGAAA